MCFAAIADRWHAPGGHVVDQVAAVTCPPNDDLRDIHHRMGVILSGGDISAWLEGDPDTGRTLCKPLGNGILHIEEARDVDWSGP